MSTMEFSKTERRVFLYITTGAVGAVGAAISVWPFVDQMNPDASVLALSSIEVDLAPIEEGQSIVINWRGNPIIIRYRTAAEIAEAEAVPLDELKDTDARNANVKDGAEASDANRVVGDKSQYLVMLGVCTHLGCVPIGDAGDYNGWFCPCHGSHYDTAGRIRKGPAPENLPVPLYEYLSDTKIRIG